MTQRIGERTIRADRRAFREKLTHLCQEQKRAKCSFRTGIRSLVLSLASRWDDDGAVSGTYLLVIVGLLAASVIVALTRKDRSPAPEDEDWPETDIVVDLEFLRARPAELDQRISDLVALSGAATLGARMRSMQLATEPPTPRPTRIRRRTRPLVASR